MSQAKCRVDVFGAEALQPDRRTQTCDCALGVVDRLIDDVPGFYLAAIARHYAFDVIGKFTLGFGGAADLFCPAGHGAVPDQRMTAHGHLVGVGEGHHLVGEIENELIAGRAQIIPEKTVFGRDLLAIGLERAPVVGFLFQRSRGSRTRRRECAGSAGLPRSCRRAPRRHGERPKCRSPALRTNLRYPALRRVVRTWVPEG